MTTWGPRIEAGSLGYPIAGTMPEWLANYTGPFNFENRQDEWLDFREPKHFAWGYTPKKPCPVSFQLPADHYAYRAIEAGFTPWGGGPNAPDDWDGGDVLRREGIMEDAIRNRLARKNGPWEHFPMVGNTDRWDIIGYHKRTITPNAKQSDPAYDQAVRLLNALTDRIGQSCAIPLPDTSGVIGQIDHVTASMAVRDDVIRECYDRLNGMGDNVSTGFKYARTMIGEMLPVDPITALAKEYEAQRKFGERGTAEDVIRWMKERKE